jgi:hypothetical protein
MHLLSTDVDAQAVRKLIAELLTFEDVNRYLLEKITALSVRYDFGSSHPLVGRRMRDVRLPHGTLYGLLHEGRGLLLDPYGRFSSAGWSDRVDHVVSRCENVDCAILLRPDGHVAWASGDNDGLATAMVRWFGEPSIGEMQPGNECQ